jgi:hypothetical protein
MAIFRVFLMLQPGWFPKQINMLMITARPHFLFIKVPGMYFSAIWSERLFPCAGPRVCISCIYIELVLKRLLSTGMAIAPWNILATGRIRTDAEEERRKQSGEGGRSTWRGTWERTENEKKMAATLEIIAKEVGTEHITAGKLLNCFVGCNPLT